MEVSPRECFQGWKRAASEGLSNSWEAGSGGFLELSRFPGSLWELRPSGFLQLAFGRVWNPEEGGPSGDTSSLVVNPEAGRVFVLVWRRRLSSCSSSSLTAGHHKPTHLPSLQPALVKSNYAFWEIRSFSRLFLWETLELRKAGSHRLLGGQSLPGLPAPHLRGERSCSESSKKPNNGSVVKSPPASAGDMDLISGWEDPRCHRATKPIRHNYWACALEPGNSTTEARVP